MRSQKKKIQNYSRIIRPDLVTGMPVQFASAYRETENGLGSGRSHFNPPISLDLVTSF